MEHNESLERHEDRKQQEEHHAQQLVQKLTFFVVGAELVFCGYILLNAKSLSGVSFAAEMYLLSGIAAISGLLWRTLYNEEMSARNGKRAPLSGALLKAQSTLYWLYIIASIVFFIGVLSVGYSYIHESSGQKAPVVDVEHGSPSNDPENNSEGEKSNQAKQ